MKYLIGLLLVISPLTDLDEIAKVNSLKKKAKEAYVKGDYKKAIEHYTYLLDSMEVEDPNITLNLANAYYQVKDSANAVNNYNSLLSSKDRVVKSVAHQQLGIMADRAKKFDLALDHFKNAIKTDPANDEARYNYEMLKKMLDEQKKNQDQQKDQENKENKDQENKDQQQQDQKNKDQQKQDQKQKQDQEQKDKEGEKQENKDQQSKEEQQKDAQDQKDKEGKEGEEKKDQQPKPEEGEENKDEKSDQEQMQSISDKLKEMKISEEKAKMILEALKNNEIQYIQQNKRKPTKRKDPNKPDW